MKLLLERSLTPKPSHDASDMIFFFLLVFLDVVVDLVFDTPLAEEEPKVIFTLDQHAGVDLEGVIKDDP
jgi:hypothetical protein